MSTILFQKPKLSSFLQHGNHSQRTTLSPKMSSNLPSSQTQIQENLSVEFQNPPTPELKNLRPLDLQFDRKQTSDEISVAHKIEFGQYVAREALVDEEYWTAAWLRAESHWEDRPPERYIDSLKRKFADQEFNALKRQCSGQNIQRCTCIVAIRKDEKNVKSTVIKSIVGTLDLSIRNLLHGERFPGEIVKAPTFSSINRTSTQRYGYVANLCVAKFARRKGIASNMLGFAIESARLKGVEQVFVHVNRKNKPAQDLYQKMGFQIVEMATSKDGNYLMSFKS